MRNVKKTITGINVRSVKSFFSDTPEEINLRIRQMAIIGGFSNYEIACMLFVVQDKGLWQHELFCVRGNRYSTFYEWVYGELGIASRRARYLKTVAERLYNLDAGKEMSKKLFLLGWPKAYQILRVAEDLESLERWYETVKDMTENEVTQTVRLALAAENAEEVQEKEGTGEVIEGSLAESISETFNYTKAENYALYKKARKKLEQRTGALANEEIMAIFASHYLSTTFPGDGFTEVPAEIEHKILEFQKAIQVEYKIKLSIGVSGGSGAVPGS